MSLEEKIIRHIQELPESKKAEVLDFVEYQKTRPMKGIGLNFRCRRQCTGWKTRSRCTLSKISRRNCLNGFNPHNETLKPIAKTADPA